MNFADTTQITINQSAAFRALERDVGGVVLHLDSGAYYELDVVGSEVWKAIGDGIGFENLVASLRAVFPDAPPNLSNDIADYLTALHERDLVSIDQAEPHA